MLQGPKATIRRARRLRREMSLPEVLLWRELRKRPAGLKFRHQHPAGPYAADFFCHDARLIVEVDGEAHGRGDRPRRDGERDGWFAERRFEVMRIPAHEVLSNLEGVVRGIVARAEQALDRPRDFAAQHGRHGGGVSALAETAWIGADATAPTPLHPLPAAGGPPPPEGEEL